MSQGSPTARLEAIDAARGLAICLMVLSHTVKGLLPFKDIPDFGLVPVHLVTKFSSTLFLLVFGVASALAFIPRVGSASWPKARRRLLFRGLMILGWYKALTVVQMFERYGREYLVETLLWQRFPDFVEILQFYGWMVLLLPWFLPAFSRLTLWPQLFIAYAVGLSSYLLRENFDFFGVWQLKAIWVEQPGVFCFGLLSRGALVLFGLALGQTVLREGNRAQKVKQLSQALAVMGVVLLGTFYVWHWEALPKLHVALAKNFGKHPPNFPFVTFTLGGAMLLLSCFLRLKEPLSSFFSPLVLLGRGSLFCFNTHVLVIFLVYRWAFDLRHDVNYAQALGLTALNLFACGAGIWAKEHLEEWWEDQREETPMERPALGHEHEGDPVTEVVENVPRNPPLPTRRR